MKPDLIILFRHGQCIDNLHNLLPHPNSPITEQGRLDVIQAAYLLKPHLKSPSFITSPFPRAYATAEILASILEGPIIKDADLREINFGKATGCTPSQFKDKFPHYAELIAQSSNLDYTWPGGESRRDLLKRVKRSLNKWLNIGGPGEIVLVSHWVPLGFLYAEILHGCIDHWDKLAPSCTTPIAFSVNNKNMDKIELELAKW
ncbi:MAG TPA: histidine phosphatase family protein [Methanosarcina sp.]|jgi:broad specificity phosphatase PhoE|nr:histidine phosphatase family protein [Methanosarcina sp.]